MVLISKRSFKYECFCTRHYGNIKFVSGFFFAMFYMFLPRKILQQQQQQQQQ